MKLLLPAFLAAAALAAAAQENLALGKSVKASSVENQRVKPEFAVDGNKKSRWSSRQRNSPQWFCVDLGSVKKVGKVVILWERYAAKDYKIQLSTDGKEWTDVVWKKDGKGGTDTLTFPQREARFVRFTGQFPVPNAYGYSFWEFQVFEQ